MNPLRVGIIGYGLGGSVFHAPLIAAEPRLQLAAIATSRSADVARDYPLVRTIRDPYALTSDPDIDLVVVTSPNVTHAPLARAALRAGKHVVVDKPMTTSLIAADELLAIASERGLLLSAFQNRRWDTYFLTLRPCIDAGRLGGVRSYEAHYDRFRLEIRPGWKENDEGSGVVYDLGPHLIDQALTLFGMPEAVTADVTLQRPGARVADYMHVVLHYRGRRAILHAGMIVPEPGPRFLVHGEGGSFSKYGLDGQEDALKAGARPGDPEWGRDRPERYATLVSAQGARETVETLPGAYERYYAGIAAALLEGAPPPVSGTDGRNVVAVIEAALRGSAERRTVAIVGVTA